MPRDGAIIFGDLIGKVPGSGYETRVHFSRSGGCEPYAAADRRKLDSIDNRRGYCSGDLFFALIHCLTAASS